MQPEPSILTEMLAWNCPVPSLSSATRRVRLTEGSHKLLYKVLYFGIYLTSFQFLAGMCQPRVSGTVGAEPFSAKIRYTGSDDPDFPNLIKLTVNMPHMDGKEYKSK